VHVLCARAKGRNLDGTHREAIVEIEAEGAGVCVCEQIAVRRGDDAHVHVTRLARADRPERALFERAEQERLERLRRFTDLVEESVLPSASSKRPRRADCAPVKAPFTWPKSSLVMTLDTTPRTVIVTIGGVASPALTISDAWAPSPILFAFGISEANSPTTGWLVHWTTSSSPSADLVRRGRS